VTALVPAMLEVMAAAVRTLCGELQQLQPRRRFAR